ncbi:WD40 repeat domain-containing protein, partial [Microcoleus sp. HI-ES]|nr:WD40 repeat domain-containing protein [Microcoleus sp. HI-ES]
MTEFKQGLDKMQLAEETHYLGILPSQLAATSDSEKLYSLLTDYNFIKAKLSASGVQALIEDYDL